MKPQNPEAAAAANPPLPDVPLMMAGPGPGAATALDPATLAALERFLLDQIRSPEARALMIRLLDRAEDLIESQTSNPFLRMLEKQAFSLVRGYLSPIGVRITASPE